MSVNTKKNHLFFSYSKYHWYEYEHRNTLQLAAYVECDCVCVCKSSLLLCTTGVTLERANDSTLYIEYTHTHTHTFLHAFTLCHCVCSTGKNVCIRVSCTIKWSFSHSESLLLTRPFRVSFGNWYQTQIYIKLIQ